LVVRNTDSPAASRQPQELNAIYPRDGLPTTSDYRPTTASPPLAGAGVSRTMEKPMSPHPDDLTGMKDDMTAFIEGLGMRRFFGYVECEEVPSVLWDSGQNPDGWKDFVELAKSTGAPFLTVHSWALDREELDRLTQVLSESDYRSDEDMEESRWLKTYVGKTGFVQLGWAYQGCVFVYEAGTDWYAHYQHLRELADEGGGFMIDEPDQDEER
jgi:hypothetical protein